MLGLRFPNYVFLFVLAFPMSQFSYGKDFCKAPLRQIPEGLTTLEPGCNYKASFKITKSNTVLNCNGAVLDGEGELSTGVLIDSEGVEVSNISVENCKVFNFKNTGIAIGWSVPDYQKSNGSHPKNITIRAVEVIGNGGVGIYVDDYVSFVKISDAIVSKNLGAGVYIEHDSNNVDISDSVFENNGWNKNGHPAQPAIAIDASEYNKVTNNLFNRNGLAAISLYRNCDEKYTEGKSVKRVKGANNNLISRNRFSNERVGVWVASRQSKDLRLMECGRNPYQIDKGAVFVPDEAVNNVISYNDFSRSEIGVKVEMGPNKITNNRFESSVGVDVEAGSKRYSSATGLYSKSIEVSPVTKKTFFVEMGGGR